MKICSIYTCKLDSYIRPTHLSSRGGSGNSQARAGGIPGELISIDSIIQIEFQGTVWILRFFCTLVIVLSEVFLSFFPLPFLNFILGRGFFVFFFSLKKSLLSLPSFTGFDFCKI